MPAKVVSFINLKGGVGKTTLALAIGEWLAFGRGAGQKVLMVDMDAQYNLSSAVLPEKDLTALWNDSKSVYHMFKATLDNEPWDVAASIVTRCSNVYDNTNLHIIVSNPELGQPDEDILSKWQAGDSPPTDLRGILSEHIQKVSRNYQWVIIDCPPSLSLFISNAILCSDYWIAPLVPEALSLYGVSFIQTRISQLRNQYGQRRVAVEFAGSILNRVDIGRSDHTREAANVYGPKNGSLQPFDCWVGDWKPLYVVSDYDYPQHEFNDRRRTHPEWSGLQEKYGWKSTAENNGGTPEKALLQGKLGLGRSYLIADVIRRLALEFKNRCQ